MKVLKIILGIVALVVVLGAVYLMTLPDTYRVERSITINASGEVVMSSIANFKEWENWSPWKAKDPEAKYTYEGPEMGEGAKMSWVTSLPPDNESQIGEGSMTVTGQNGNESVNYDLAFIKPWEMGSKGGFNLSADEGGNTVVNWWDEGGLPFLMRPMGSQMDAWIGPDFEEGLAKLKAYCESKKPEGPSNDFVVEEVVVEAIPYLSMTDSCTVEMISESLGKMYGAIMGHCGENQVESAGAPFAIYHSWDGKATRVEAGIPLAEAIKGTDAIESKTLYAGNALKLVYMGPYDQGEVAHNAVADYAEANGKEIVGPPWEVYVTDPGNEPDPNKYITEIYYPIN
ncbi:MAG: hypothetical protein CL840_16130 [Crocinitomicaceae bacterium]|nr:hypothetical protein [Crocinitomicaceae bacterium]|tara:strand:+ start:17949 stop:18977 length:1029 start_codon:yes stop_codon:yes gene_type:complete